MRVRFIPIGDAAHQWVVVDRLPFELDQLAAGEPVGGFVADVDGTLVFENEEADPRVRVNRRPLHRGVLMPGDRLSIGDREFVISYERLTASLPVTASYHLIDDERTGAV